MLYILEQYHPGLGYGSCLSSIIQIRASASLTETGRKQFWFFTAGCLPEKIVLMTYSTDTFQDWYFWICQFDICRLTSSSEYNHPWLKISTGPIFSSGDYINIKIFSWTNEMRWEFFKKLFNNRFSFLTLSNQLKVPVLFICLAVKQYFAISDFFFNKFWLIFNDILSRSKCVIKVCDYENHSLYVLMANILLNHLIG